MVLKGFRIEGVLERCMNENMGKRMVKVPKNRFKQLLTPTYLNRLGVGRENTQNTTMYILGLNSTSLDVVEFFHNKALSNLLPVCLNFYQNPYIQGKH